MPLYRSKTENIVLIVQRSEMCIEIDNLQKVEEILTLNEICKRYTQTKKITSNDS